MHGQTISIVLAAILSASTVQPQAPRFARLRSSGHHALCNHSGEVLRRNVSEQMFVIQREDDGGIESLPFSRWTIFLTRESPAAKPESVEPTAVHIGDQVCVQLDANESYARWVIVIKRAKPEQGI